MKKLYLIFLMLIMALWCVGMNPSANGTIIDGYLIVEDFEGATASIGHEIIGGSGTTEINANPDGIGNSLLATNGGYGRWLQLSITLPGGKSLSDYESLYFDIYYGTTGDNTYKDVKYSFNNDSKIDIDKTQNNLGVWKTLSIDVDGLTIGNSFTFEVGYNSDNGGNFRVDNIKLSGAVPDGNVYTVTLNSGTGTCAYASLTETEEGAGVTLPVAFPSTKCALDDYGYTFAGWATESVESTDVAPDMLAAGAWAIDENTTLYAVYTDGAVYETNPRCSASLNGTVTDGWLMLEDFDAGDIDDALMLVAPYPVSQDAFAKIAEDPKDDQQQVAHAVIKNWDEYLSIEATLPGNKTLANYETLDFDIYYNSVSGTDNGYKDFLLQFDAVPGTSNYFFKESTGGTGDHQKWIHKSLDLTGVSSGNTVAINLGIRGNNANYFVDNIKLKERFVEQGFTVKFNSGAGTNDTEFLIEEEVASGIIVPEAALVTEEANNDGWSFYGWAEEVVHETNVAPNIKTPSSAYMPESNITLYAVYTDGTFYNTYPTTAVSQKGTFTSKFIFLVEDFETQVVGTEYDLFNTAEHAVSGTAAIALNPTNLNERAIHILSTDYDNLLELPINLPEGSPISAYEQISFDFYWKEVDYKKMVVYIDDIKIYEDDDYISQAPAATWTQKTYDFDVEQSLGDKEEVMLRLGLSSNAGDYYLDNINLKIKESFVTGIDKLQEKLIIITDNQVHLNESGLVQVLDINGRTVISSSNTQLVDLNMLNSGVYIVKVLISGNAYVLKHIKN